MISLFQWMQKNDDTARQDAERQEETQRASEALSDRQQEQVQRHELDREREEKRRHDQALAGRRVMEEYAQRVREEDEQKRRSSQEQERQSLEQSR